MKDPNLRGLTGVPSPDASIQEHRLRCLDDLNQIEAAAQAIADDPGSLVNERSGLCDTGNKPVADERCRQSVLKVMALVRHARQQLLGLAAPESAN